MEPKKKYQNFLKIETYALTNKNNQIKNLFSTL